MSRNNGSKPAWHSLPAGGVIENPGNATLYETGEWRVEKPVYNTEHCIQCLLCWVYCPDSAIDVCDGKVIGIDYYHCKGCGICVHECPRTGRALEMIPEEVQRD